jgi:hypothetical protein
VATTAQPSISSKHTSRTRCTSSCSGTHGRSCDESHASCHRCGCIVASAVRSTSPRASCKLYMRRPFNVIGTWRVRLTPLWKHWGASISL